MSFYDTEGALVVQNEGDDLPRGQESQRNNVICFHMMIGFNLGRLRGAQRESFWGGLSSPACNARWKVHSFLCSVSNLSGGPYLVE